MRLETTRRAALAVVVAFALVGMVACAGRGGEGSEPGPSEPTAATAAALPVAGGTLVVAIGDDGGGWNPALDRWSPAQLQVARSVYDRLAVYDDGNQVRPQLARSITADDDLTRWTIALRPGVTFHDGTPVDAAAVVANLEAQRRSPLWGPLFEPVEAVTAADPLTVVVDTRTPWSTFEHVLAAQPGTIAAPATLDAATGTAPVGSGPFTFAAHVPGESITLVRNPASWRPPAQADAVELVVEPDPLRRAAALEAGRVDVALFDEPGTIVGLRDAAEAGELQLVLDREAEAPKLTVVLDTASAPFLDPDARQALDLATDRRAWWDAGSGGVLRPALSPAADESVWFQGDPLPIRDVGSAAALAEAHAERYGQPLAFELLVPDEPTSLAMATLWQGQLAEAGIEVALEPLPIEEVRRRAEAGDHQAAMLPLFGSWHPDLWHPALHRAEITPVGTPGPNLARYGTAAIDAALDAARASVDLATQVDQYRAVQTALGESDAYLYVVRLAQAVAAGPDVADLTTWTTAEGEPGLPSEGGTVDLTAAHVAP